MYNSLRPLEAPFPEEVDQILAQYPQQDGYILTLFRTFANSVRFLTKGVPNLLDGESPINLRTREIVILRTTANRNCEYEWGVHVAIFSKAAGLGEQQIHATRIDDDDCWPYEERLLITIVDQLCSTGGLDQELLLQFQRNWSNEQQLEIIALIGAYSTISYVANVAQLPPESFGARFPDAK